MSIPAEIIYFFETAHSHFLGSVILPKWSELALPLPIIDMKINQLSRNEFGKKIEILYIFYTQT